MKKTTRKRDPAAPSLNTFVPALPPGIWAHATIRTTRNGPAFVKALGPDGREHVYSVPVNRSLGVDLDQQWGMNDTIRRAYCRLAGIPFATLKEVIKAKRAAAAERENSREVARLRARASGLGYRIVKERP